MYGLIEEGKSQAATATEDAEARVHGYTADEWLNKPQELGAVPETLGFRTGGTG